MSFVHWPSAPRTLVCLTVIGLVAASSAGAAVITVTASPGIVAVGQNVDVSFKVSGLTGIAGSSLSGFDIDVLFDDAILSLVSASFVDPPSAVNQLDWPEAGAFPYAGDAMAVGGRIDAFGVSGNSQTVLDAEQAAAFAFLRLRFLALAPTGGTIVGLDVADPSLLFLDSAGGLLDLDFSGGTAAAITVTSKAVPEPLSLLLIGVGSLACGVRRRFRAS